MAAILVSAGGAGPACPDGPRRFASPFDAPVVAPAGGAR